MRCLSYRLIKIQIWFTSAYLLCDKTSLKPLQPSKVLGCDATIGTVATAELSGRWINWSFTGTGWKGELLVLITDMQSGIYKSQCAGWWGERPYSVQLHLNSLLAFLPTTCSNRISTSTGHFSLISLAYSLIRFWRGVEAFKATMRWPATVSLFSQSA
jgi:hypothetical protein